ncbi:glycosyltransferase family 2 protein [Marinilongibacter aquaticus]|uniref:glycosyltransferase family 2 protein n=1 Tax=Marinilongibacter aquaticus TaxID=2975157 RepID=UPI0021BD3E17|nr:glycosyltransferase family 2 protein [Marinilongibacter aquaticus]UBM60731.1 glycosyltransferase family 2 protein [Marinilongibacter aquaticus]
MTEGIKSHADVSLLITHYNRSSSLERLLSALRDLKIEFFEIIVSDDCSAEKHLRKLQELQKEFGITLLRSPQNQGLGHNINKGQSAVKSPFTLYVQEDFVPYPLFKEKLCDAKRFMEEDPDLDLVRFYAFVDYPEKKDFACGFSELIFTWRNPSHLKFYKYSDHPHLRRTSFQDKFGKYIEGRPGDETEFDMSLRFLKRNGKALFYREFSSLFDHSNPSHEPSTMDRVKWTESKNGFVLFLRFFYLRFRWLKNTFQLLTYRS